MHYYCILLILKSVFSTFVPEEVLHQLSAFLLQNTANDAAFGMQGMRSMVRIAPFFVTTAIDDAGNLAPSQGPGTHHAGLNSDV